MQVSTLTFFLSSPMPKFTTYVSFRCGFTSFSSCSTILLKYGGSPQSSFSSPSAWHIGHSKSTSESSILLLLQDSTSDLTKEQTPKPRPNNRVGTIGLHWICHANLGSFDNFSIPQFKVRRTWLHPNWSGLRGFFVYHRRLTLAHPSCTDEAFVDVTNRDPFRL